MEVLVVASGPLLFVRQSACGKPESPQTGGVIEVTRVIEAEPDDVLAILTNGWTYSGWVVGASTIRAVDDKFPLPGSRIHHSVGSWPVLISDTTHVLEYEPGYRLKLEARGWPLGQATVEITVESHPRGSLVTMIEDASQGPARLLPQPVRQLSIAPRNRESLRRLGYLAEGRATAKPQ